MGLHLSLMIHFELIFVESVRFGLKFIYLFILALNVQLFQCYLLQSLSLHQTAFSYLSMISRAYLCGSVSLLSISLSYVSISKSQCPYQNQHHTRCIGVCLTS